MINVSVMGATGYAGIELVRLLAGHPNVKICEVISHSFVGQKLSDVYPHLRGVVDLVCQDVDAERTARTCDVAFTALPHGASKEVIPKLMEAGLKVIDLSGDYRYNDPAVYEKWYGQPHTSPDLLEKSVYGLCELHRDKIKNTDLVGNPGCYTTCSILGAAPLVKAGLVDVNSIIIDAKSGVTGAGRGLSQGTHFCECTENSKAYKVATHRHTSEIEQELSLLAEQDIMLSFTPHLIPQKRGILATIYMNLNGKHTTAELLQLYREFYEGEQFVRIMNEGTLPETNHTATTNFVDIGLVVDERLNRVVVVSAIDNLVKGAAGQAVQNMNIMFGLKENAGLTAPGTLF